jgi:hypothetical protein
MLKLSGLKTVKHTGQYNGVGRLTSDDVHASVGTP